MNADQFVSKIRELKQLFPDDSIAARLIIAEKSAVEPMYDDPLLDLMHRYDLSKTDWSIISFNSGIYEMDLMYDEDNVIFNKLYYYLGSFNEGWFVLSKASKEVLNIAEDDILIEHNNTCSYMALNSETFLDTLYCNIEYCVGNDEKYTQDSLNSHIMDIIEYSGGLKYARFWTSYILESLAEYYHLTLPDL